MFWGLKLERGNNYSQMVDNSFHISHATLSPGSPGDDLTATLVAIHAIVNEEDYILCYLGKLGSPIFQQSLNLDFAEGEKITLYVDHVSDSTLSTKSNDSIVHLTGYFIPSFSGGYHDSVSEDDEDLQDDLGSEEDNLVEGANKDSVRTLPPVIEELSDEEKIECPVAKKRKRSDVIQSSTTGNDTVKKKVKKKTKRKIVSSGEVNGCKKEKHDANGQTKVDSKVKKMSIFKTNGGTEIEEIQEGSGKQAKPGRKVFVKYTGRLAHNNQIFDSNINGKRPFLFRLGQGEVIKGWDEGLRGMKIGGKRRLTIPPSQGYGSKGAPPKIPPNSKLVFDIELADLK